MYEKNNEQINKLNETIKNNENTIYNLSNENNDLKDIIKELNNFKTQIEIKNKDLSALLALQNKQNDSIEELNQTIIKQKEKIEKMESSKSWKITEPLRKIIDKLRFKQTNEKLLEE